VSTAIGLFRYSRRSDAKHRGYGAGAAVSVAALAIACAGAAASDVAAGCAPPRAGADYTAKVMRALRARTDLWGEQLLATRDGPTYAGARRFLSPLLFAGGPGQRPLTASGFHYVPFSLPVDAEGATSVALHLADGSEIAADRIGGRAVFVFAGGERYGACLARLTPGRLADGWLPILGTRYVDAAGNRYEQESFAGRAAAGGPLASFVRITVRARGDALARLSVEGGSELTVRAPAGATRALHAVWERGPGLRTVAGAAYQAARRTTAAYWRKRLGEGATVAVPEEIVMDAQRAVLVQNLVLTWRYSIGNPYEEFSFPEGVDAAQVAAEWGHRTVSRAILRRSLTRKPTPYPNWKKGEKLVGSALYYRLHRDRSYVARATPTLRGYVDVLGRQLEASPRGLLAQERYSSDIPDTVYGLHSQAVVWQGLAAMRDVWSETGHTAHAARARALAQRLEPGLRRAVAASQRRLADGSLFLPISLLAGERPYGSLTEARLGSYWNLVMPYALASGLFRPGSVEAEGVFRYMRLHGSRLLGLVRAGAYALYGQTARFPDGGTDEVYGINVARFLADNDEADQLVLGLYGQLAVAMTPGTFVGGEAASVAPLRGDYHRSTYLPPNGASNGAFLTKLRLLLVHEPRDAAGEPSGLELGFSTPRAWLRAGKRIAVRRMPTSFGPVSYQLDAQRRSVRATIDVPARQAPAALALRLRLPDGRRIVAVRVAGRRWRRFDPGTGTIELNGERGRIELVVETT
jgi:hypothetical protein